MSKPSTAASHMNPDNQYQTPVEDPFATPTWKPIQHPKPIAYTPDNSRRSNNVVENEASSSRHDRRPSSHQAGLSYKSSSLSSGGSSAKTGGIPSIDLEKMDAEKNAPNDHNSFRDSQRMGSISRDPEKGGPAGSPRTPHTTNLSYEDNDDDDEDGIALQEAKALRILLYLSGPCVCLSFLNALWTIISLFITLFTQPVRICARRPSFGLQLSGLLGPALNLQLRSIYTPLSPHANEDGSYHAFKLVMVHLSSPFTSLAMMLVAWVVAVYWASSAVVGDPAGMDKQDDGRETVLALRRKWENYLLKGVKEE